uniref:Uncharacterized protein n=1 Tax=Helianthus annuus TaxID=4232 RepID=A0A251VLT5_HELAN
MKKWGSDHLVTAAHGRGRERGRDREKGGKNGSERDRCGRVDCRQSGFRRRYKRQFFLVVVRASHQMKYLLFIHYGQHL